MESAYQVVPVLRLSSHSSMISSLCIISSVVFDNSRKFLFIINIHNYALLQLFGCAQISGASKVFGRSCVVKFFEYAVECANVVESTMESDFHDGVVRCR